VRTTLLGIAIASVVAALASAQPATRFTLGTFERDGAAFVGLVVGDEFVADIGRAWGTFGAAADVPPPADMKDLIARFDRGIRARLVAIASAVAGGTAARPRYVVPLDSVKTLPPILYPTTMLNAAVNYREHAQEMGIQSSPGGAAAPGTALPGTVSAPGIWERKPDDTRWNPYLFVKLPTAVIASGEAIRIPPGRTQIDWECELGVVIGRQATRVPVERAREYIFGYTLENDVSDRAGRGDTRHGNDWLIAKSHDTFAPMGPVIVPAEFVPNPQALKVTFTLNGKVMQDASTSLMIHSVFELVSYASHITTLRPGDVIATGSPAGVGAARTPPIFLRAGDEAVCAYEGVGVLRNRVDGPE